MNEKIVAALKQLDVANDAHWTGDGLPKLENVRMLAGDFALSREAVTNALPGFSRATPNVVQPAPVKLTPIVPLGGSNATPATDSDAGGSTSQTQSEGAQAKLAEALEAAKQRLSVASAAKAKTDQEHAKATAEVDALITKLEESGTGETFQTQFAAYKKRQAEMREERGMKLKMLKESGIKLSDILPTKAKIDEALARKTGRFGQRPTQI